MSSDNRVIETTSWDDVTIGLVNAIGTLLAVLDERIAREAKRLKRNPDDDHAWFSEAVQNALTDLRFSQPMANLVHHNDERAMDIIRAAAAALRERPGA